MDAKQVEQTLKDFEKADLNLIRDAKWRRRAEELRAKQSGFTLLELLVVVAILAIIAGAVLASLDGKEEGAAQATAVHTMATLEDSMRIYKVTEKRVLPGELDSLLCSAGVQADYTATIAQVDTGAAAARVLSAADATSNVPRVNGGLTADLYNKLTLVGVTSGALSSLTENGLTSLRYVNDELCNGSTGNDLFTTAGGFDEDVVEIDLVEVTKPSMVFADPLVEDDDWEFGAGASVNLTDLTSLTTEALPIAFFNEPAELGEEEEAVLAVFGVGPSADLGSVIARAPQDGNAGPDKYANYSIVVKVAECPDGNEIGDAGCAVNLWDEVGEDVRVVAVLDAGGDGYDDEIAEAKGNEEE